MSKQATKRLVALIEKMDGLTVEKGKRSGHYKVRRGGRVIGGFPSTPSDGRGMMNAVAELRRAGVPIPRHWRN